MGFACCESFDEGPSVWRTEYPRAGKIHKCAECGHVIAPGESYRRTFFVFEGDANTYIACERCDDLMGAFSDVGYCPGLGDFFENYADWLEGQKTGGGVRAAAIKAKHREWPR